MFQRTAAITKALNRELMQFSASIANTTRTTIATEAKQSCAQLYVADKEGTLLLIDRCSKIDSTFIADIGELSQPPSPVILSSKDIDPFGHHISAMPIDDAKALDLTWSDAVDLSPLNRGYPIKVTKENPLVLVLLPAILLIPSGTRNLPDIFSVKELSEPFDPPAAIKDTAHVQPWLIAMSYVHTVHGGNSLHKSTDPTIVKYDIPTKIVNHTTLSTLGPIQPKAYVDLIPVTNLNPRHRPLLSSFSSIKDSEENGILNALFLNLSPEDMVRAMSDSTPPTPQPGLQNPNPSNDVSQSLLLAVSNLNDKDHESKKEIVIRRTNSFRILLAGAIPQEHSQYGFKTDSATPGTVSSDLTKFLSSKNFNLTAETFTNRLKRRMVDTPDPFLQPLIGDNWIRGIIDPNLLKAIFLCQLSTVDLNLDIHRLPQQVGNSLTIWAFTPFPDNSTKLRKISTALENILQESSLPDEPDRKRTKLSNEIMIGYNLTEYAHILETLANLTAFFSSLMPPDEYKSSIIFHILDPFIAIFKGKEAQRFFKKWKHELPLVGAIMLEPVHLAITDLFKLAKEYNDLDLPLPSTIELPEIASIMLDVQTNMTVMTTAFRRGQLYDNFGKSVPEYLSKLTTLTKFQESTATPGGTQHHTQPSILNPRPASRPSSRPSSRNSGRVRFNDSRPSTPQRERRPSINGTSHTPNQTPPFVPAPGAPGMLTFTGDFAQLPKPTAGKARHHSGSMVRPCLAYLCREIRCSFATADCRFAHVNAKADITEDNPGFCRFVESTPNLDWWRSTRPQN